MRFRNTRTNDMATYLYKVESSAALAPAYVPPLKGKQICSLTQVITVATSDIDTGAETMDVGWLPKGAIVIDAVMHCSDMDTGSTLVFDLGPTTNPDGYIDGLAATTAATGRAGNVAGAAATMATEASVPLTADTKVIVTTATAATTPAAGTILVSIQYVV
jgi:hypothetical protein